jgi:hypothetical protein
MSFSVSGYFTVQPGEYGAPGTAYYLLQLVPGETITWETSMITTGQNIQGQEFLIVYPAPGASGGGGLQFDLLDQTGGTEAGVISVSGGPFFVDRNPTPEQYDVTVPNVAPYTPYYLTFDTYPGWSVTDAPYLAGFNVTVSDTNVGAPPPPAPPPLLTPEAKAQLREAADALDRLSHALDVLNVDGSYKTLALRVANWAPRRSPVSFPRASVSRILSCRPLWRPPAPRSTCSRTSIPSFSHWALPR